MTVETKFTPWMYAVTRVVTRSFFRWKFRITVHGVEQVPATGGVILAANHASFLDPPLIGYPIKQRHVCFMARDTLLKHPITAWLFPRIGVVPLSREKGDIGAIKSAIALLKSGECVCLFPEGTRTTDGQLQPPKGGIGFLIAKAAVPVVPVYISGTFEAYPKGAKKIRPGSLSISYGPPIRPDELLITNEKGKVDFDGIGRLVMDRIARLKAPNA
jgi:1-acyl-sn-glycerol-3-phosphate acyltransferase